MQRNKPLLIKKEKKRVEAASALERYNINFKVPE